MSVFTGKVAMVAATGLMAFFSAGYGGTGELLYISPVHGNIKNSYDLS
jgi:hypothetical protein